MITAEENEMLTKVGPGTPAGELLRRYWHPISIAADITPENPTKFVRILGGRPGALSDANGEPGLLHDRCPHRGASLSYGRCEERGISCAYHGWLFNSKGDCLETPAEPADSKFHLTVKHKAYPVKKLAGLYWAYMGPLPAPEIPSGMSGRAPTAGIGSAPCRRSTVTGCRRWRTRSTRRICTYFIRSWLPTALKSPSTTRGTIDNLDKYETEEFEYGIIKRRVFSDGKIEEHRCCFPLGCVRPIARKSACRSTTRTPILSTFTLFPTPPVRVPRREVPVNYRRPFKKSAGSTPSGRQTSPRRGRRSGFHGLGNSRADS